MRRREEGDEEGVEGRRWEEEEEGRRKEGGRRWEEEGVGGWVAEFSRYSCPLRLLFS